MNDSNTVLADPAHRNEDPLTHEPGAHPVATGVGAAGGGAAGAAIGMVVAGPVGGAIGAVLGAFAGGFGGHAVGESFQPTESGGGANVAGAADAAGTGTTVDEPVPWHEMVPSGLPSHDEIALRAWCIYEAEGKPTGQDIRHWLEAEAMLRADGSTANLF